jgi:hypothetical protein
MNQNDLVQFRGLMVAPDHPARLRAAQLIPYLIDLEENNRIDRLAHLGIPGPLVCPECGAIPGQYHLLGCSHEICPKCREKLKECGCLVLYKHGEPTL